MSPPPPVAAPAADGPPAPALEVSLAYSLASRRVHHHALSLPAGSTVGDALKAAGLESEVAPGVELAQWTIGVWGRKAPLNQPLRAHDRVELWRPLRVDPKLARRERFGRQGARAAGLFAQRRPGAKPGY